MHHEKDLAGVSRKSEEGRTRNGSNFSQSSVNKARQYPSEDYGQQSVAHVRSVRTRKYVTMMLEPAIALSKGGNLYKSA